MDTRHIRAAVEVARSGSFTEASRRLFMAQSTVSRQVACLERDLGVQLFERGSRWVEPTDRGRAFLLQAEIVLTAVDDAHRACQGSHPSAGLARAGERLPARPG